MISEIDWRTGTPEVEEAYIVSLKDGEVGIDVWTGCDNKWRVYVASFVTAWCPLSDIAPYNENE